MDYVTFWTQGALGYTLDLSLIRDVCCLNENASVKNMYIIINNMYIDIYTLDNDDKIDFALNYSNWKQNNFEQWFWSRFYNIETVF